jgi:hypothetical protein
MFLAIQKLAIMKIRKLNILKEITPKKFAIAEIAFFVIHYFRQLMVPCTKRYNR